MKDKDLGIVSLMYHKLSKNFLTICVLQNSHFLWEIQAETLFVCPKLLGTHTKFQLEIFIINVISAIVYFHKIILESWQNVSESPVQCT